MKELFFFMALLSFLWLIGLVLYWIPPAPGKERNAIKAQHTKTLEKTGLSNRLIAILFTIFNAHILYPITATVIAVLIIVFFIFT